MEQSILRVLVLLLFLNIFRCATTFQVPSDLGVTSHHQHLTSTTHLDVSSSSSTHVATPGSFPRVQNSTIDGGGGGYTTQRQVPADFTDWANAIWQKDRVNKQIRHKELQRKYRIYCDLDGVLVDFEAGIRSLFPDIKTVGSFHVDIQRSAMWKRVKEADSFFERLPWTRDGQRLWHAIRSLQPTILTGVPEHVSSREEKLRWCQRELGVDVHHIDMAGSRGSHVNVCGNSRKDGVCNVITCWSDNKHYESGPNAVLIDDREFLRHNWEAAGGIFVHHRGDAEATLRKLREIGVLPEHDIMP